jgi:ribose/xylose/arabinose/galactoside ABC-type transport system permease subunit
MTSVEAGQPRHLPGPSMTHVPKVGNHTIAIGKNESHVRIMCVRVRTAHINVDAVVLGIAKT